MNDRSLRNIVIGLGGRMQGIPREGGFDITAASEIMAIFCLATDVDDLRERLDHILVGTTWKGGPVYLKPLNITGAMMALLRDALKSILSTDYSSCTNNRLHSFASS